VSETCQYRSVFKTLAAHSHQRLPGLSFLLRGEILKPARFYRKYTEFLHSPPRYRAVRPQRKVTIAPPFAVASGTSARVMLDGFGGAAAMWQTRLMVAAVPLQHLDLVPVGVLHEKETRHQRAVAMELFDRVGCSKRACSPSRFSTANATWP
jgi:hypothetical protein